MKLRNKKTGGLANILGEQEFFRVYTDAGWADYSSLAELNEEWEDYAPQEPLIKDEKIRKAVRAWADANGFGVFKVYNQHFNYVKIHGTKDRYDPNGTTIEFKGTIAGVEKRTYEIDELCGEEEE